MTDKKSKHKEFVKKHIKKAKKAVFSLTKFLVKEKPKNPDKKKPL